MTHSEMRSEAWRICRTRGCFGAYVVVWLVLSLFIGFVNQCWQMAVREMGIQTWGMFPEAKSKALISGLDLTVPSRTVSLRMTGATAFEYFIDCIVFGIVVYGFSVFFLNAAKGDLDRWLGRSLGGFRRPLGLAWLYCNFSLRALFSFAVVFFALVEFGAFLNGLAQLAVMSLGFVLSFLALVVVIYRYCQCFNLKADNPDWSAFRCLRESARMMKGNLWRRILLDCAYWKPFTLWLLGCIAAVLLRSIPGTATEVAGSALALVCTCGFIVLCVYYGIGQALFYHALKNGCVSKELDK